VTRFAQHIAGINTVLALPLQESDDRGRPAEAELNNPSNRRRISDAEIDAFPEGWPWPNTRDYRREFNSGSNRPRNATAEAEEQDSCVVCREELGVDNPESNKYCAGMHSEKVCEPCVSKVNVTINPDGTETRELMIKRCPICRRGADGMPQGPMAGGGIEVLDQAPLQQVVHFTATAMRRFIALRVGFLRFIPAATSGQDGYISVVLNAAQMGALPDAMPSGWFIDSSEE
jgi:hypothetical protein